MRRRNFLTMIAGTFLSLFIPRTIRGARPEGYYYDWSYDPPKNTIGVSGCYSTDPLFKDGNLPFGAEDVHEVFLNGKSLGCSVQRFQTGTNGWVEWVEFAPCRAWVKEKGWVDGLGKCAKTEVYNRWEDRVLTDEESKGLRWQCIHPDDPNNPKYEERFVRHRVMGCVQYVVHKLS